MTRNILFVCSGNTCRSPMAEGLARRMLDREVPGETTVSSAGVYASDGDRASAQAVEAVKTYGVDLSAHRSRLLTPELIQEADEIYCMTAAHREAVLDMEPDAESKTQLLDASGADISDPFGADIALYRECARDIQDQLLARLKELTT